MTTRDATAALITASKQPELRSVYFFRAEFDSGTGAFHTRLGDIIFEGVTYKGIGSLGSISAIEESSEIQANNVRVTLSGIDGTNITIALTEKYQNKPCLIHYGLLDDNYALVVSPVLIFKGALDTMDISVGDVATVSVLCQNRFADWQKAKPRYYTDTEQKKLFPGDRGFELMQESQERKILWGRTV